jgi:acetyl-CoA/propionyl-CoA carboxylase biotin carboxyl carrier protein
VRGSPPFERVLIANRGEIALRIARACRELDVRPVAVYGDGDELSLHVRACDDAYRLPPGSTLPYLNIPALIDIAKQAGVQAVHPGYGFLSENASFAEAVELAGFVFIGPTPDNMRTLGEKIAAREVARRAGVPITPGSDGPIQNVEAARAWAAKHGFPLAVKASAGGGGRGFRVARCDAELEDAFRGSSGEAQRYFANPTVYLERYLERPRHVEVQIMADTRGNVVALGERDCSVQRRHQKLIEETPSPAVTPPVRDGLLQASVALAKAVGYRGAGTCEFLLAGDGTFYFLEMNTRIQVEHTVTEEVSGIDLVKEQILVAAGQSLSFTSESIATRGHAIQCRINAEDAARDFKPVPGALTRFRPPDGFGIRVDSAMEDGGSISPAYDSLIAKLVAWGRDRDEAIARMARALAEFEIEGVPTTLPFHQRVMENEAFRGGGATTAFLAEYPDVIPPSQESASVTPGSATPDGRTEIVVEVNSRRFTVSLPDGVMQNGNQATVAKGAPVRRRAKAGIGTAASGPDLTSPIQGVVLRVAVEPGQRVTQGMLVCVVEAMKMENEIVAHRDGVVSAVPVQLGATVGIGAVLATIESS